VPLLRFDLEAKYASVMDALERIERQSGRAVAKVEGDFKKLGASIGASLGAALSVGAITASFGQAVTAMADLDDAAESTGASVESLSSLLNTLAPTGVTLETIADAAGKLTKAMQGSDEESSKAGEAFRNLGIATRDSAGGLRAVDDVLTDLARALTTYGDSTDKVAYAQAIFGRTGASLLPLLKDLATREREASTVTSEQAAAAEELANNWRSLGVQADILKQDLASKVIPSLNDTITAFNNARRAGLGFLDALKLGLGLDAFVPAAVQSEIEAIAALREKITNPRGLGEVLDVPKNEAELQRRERLLVQLLERYKQLGIVQAEVDRPAFSDARFGSQRRLPGLTGGDDDKARRKAAEDAARARRELDELVAQSDVDDQIKQEAAAAKAFADATKDLVAQFERFEAVEITSKTAALGPDLKFFERVAAIMADLPSKVRANAEALTSYFDNRFFDGLISEEDWQAAIDRVNGITRNAKDETEKLSAAARDLGSTWESAFEKAVIGGEDARKVLQGFLQDIARVGLRELVSKPITSYLFGGEGGGGALTGFLSSLGIGARAAGGPVSAGMPYLVGEQGPEVIVPKMPGTVIPNGALAGGALQVNVPLMVSDSMSRADTYNLVERAKREVLQTVGMGFARGALSGA
jgi:hypothetical protein